MKRHALIAYLRSQGCELLLEVVGEALERMTPNAGLMYRAAKVTKYVALPEQSI